MVFSTQCLRGQSAVWCLTDVVQWVSLFFLYWTSARFIWLLKLFVWSWLETFYCRVQIDITAFGLVAKSIYCNCKLWPPTCYILNSNEEIECFCVGAFVKTALSACGIVDKKKEKEREEPPRHFWNKDFKESLFHDLFEECFNSMSGVCLHHQTVWRKNLVFKSILALFSDLLLHFVVVGVFFLPTLNLCRDR